MGLTVKPWPCRAGVAGLPMCESAQACFSSVFSGALKNPPASSRSWDWTAALPGGVSPGPGPSPLSGRRYPSFMSLLRPPGRFCLISGKSNQKISGFPRSKKIHKE